MTIPRSRKPRADPNPDGTADVVDISTSMSPELTETLTSRVLGNDQVLAQLHNITERAARIADERVATMSTPELDSAVAGSREDKLALAELETGLAKYGLTPLDTVAGLIKLRRALVEAYRDNELVPVQTRLAAWKLTHELQILEAKQSHATAAERNRAEISSINSALDLDTAAVDARENTVKPPERSQLVDVQSSLIQRRTPALAAGVRKPETRPVRGGLGSLLAVMCAALGLVIGAGSSLALALPELARSTGATQTELTWVVNVYALVFAALLLPVGIAADRFGRRGALLLGLTLFATTSLASGLVGDPTVLIVLRALAGAGAAAVMPATLSVLVDAYPPERRGKAISVWAAVSGAGALLGLVLAGVLLESLWWGSVQVAFGAASLAVLALCALVVPASRNPALPLDPLGGVLALVGLGGVVFGVIEGPERGWTDAVTLSGLVVGVLALGAFVRHELRSPHPMLDVRLFRSPGLFAGSAVVFLQFFAAFGLFFLAPQWLQYVHGQSPLQAALWLTPMALGIGPTAQAAPALLRRFGARAVAAWGMGQMATALVLLAWQADGRTGLWQFACTLFVFGVGFGLALTPATTLIIEGLPADRRTLSAAVNDVTREVGGALGGAVAASVLLAVYGDEVLDVAAGLPTPAAAAAESGIAQALGVAGGLGPAGAAVADGALHAFAVGDAASMLVGAAALFTGAVVCGLAAPSAARRQQRAPGSSERRIGHRNRAGGRHSARAVAARTGGRPTAGHVFVTGQDGDGGGGAVRAQGKAFAGQPTQGALNDPPLPAQALAGVDAEPGDPGGDAAPRR